MVKWQNLSFNQHKVEIGLIIVAIPVVGEAEVSSTNIWSVC